MQVLYCKTGLNEFHLPTHPYAFKAQTALAIRLIILYVLCVSVCVCTRKCVLYMEPLFKRTVSEVPIVYSFVHKSTSEIRTPL